MSAVPAGGPGSKYQFSPVDDRKAVAGGVGDEYRALAVADEELSSMLDGDSPYETKLVNQLQRARNAVRQAGFSVVMYHGEESVAE